MNNIKINWTSILFSSV